MVKRSSLFCVAAVFLTLSLSGCGGGDSSPPPSATPPSKEVQEAMAKAKAQMAVDKTDKGSSSATEKK